MKTSSKTLIWIAAVSAVIVGGLFVAFNYDSISASIAAKRERTKLRKQLSQIQVDTTAIDCFHNIILMDQSGSMSSLRESAIDGAQEIINSIRVAQDTIKNAGQNLTLAFFDGAQELRLKYVVDNQPIGDAIADLKQYSPDGNTPLHDAIGTVIMNHLSKVGPHDYVMMTIITDGLENASQKYYAADIKAMVDSLSAKNWAFTYIGANQDAILEGGRIGIRDSYNYDNTRSGYRRMIGSENLRRNHEISRITNQRGRKNGK